MKLDEYVDEALKLWRLRKGSLEELFVMTTGLRGETGEVEDILKKWVSKGMVPEKLNQEHLKEELGDALYYLVMLAKRFGFSMEEIMEYNITKLKKRAKHGKDLLYVSYFSVLSCRPDYWFEFRRRFRLAPRNEDHAR